MRKTKDGRERGLVPRLLAMASLVLESFLHALAFEGRVLHPDGKPAAGATVSVLSQTGAALTDEQGAFRWVPDPPLPFELIVVLANGQNAPPILVETLPEKGSLVVFLRPAMVEKIAIAGAAPHIEATPASATTTLSREAIEERHTLHLADLLENLPGSGRLEEGHSVVPSLRGLARGRTLILLDGARVSAERRAGPSATYLDPFFLDSIEIARGPGSLAYGSDAFGGVIDARTRKPEAGAPLAFRFQGSVGEGLPERSAGVEISRGVAAGGFLVMLRARDFDDYRSPRGLVINSAAEDRGLLASFNQVTGPGVLTVGWESDFGRDIGKPDLTSDVTRAFYPREDSHRLTASYDFQPPGGLTQLGMSGFVGTYRLVLDRDRRASETVPREVQRSDVEAIDFGLRAHADHPLKKAKVRLGLDLNGRTGLDAVVSELEYDLSGSLLSRTDEASIEDADRADAALYASIDFPVAKLLTASAGARADQVKTRNVGGFFGDRSTSHGAFGAYAALTAGSFHGLTATAQIARGFRDPTLSDRYFVGVSGRGFVTGNPDLEPETSLQADLALRYTREGLRFGLYGYRYRIENLVERYEATPGQFFFRNRGLALLRGIEVEAEAMTAIGFSAAISGQIASGEALDDGSSLDDSPATGVTLTLRQELRERGYLFTRAAAYRRDGNPGPTERVVPGFGTLDLGGGWNVGRGVELKLLLRNVTDKEYPSTADAKAVLAPGRTGLAVLTVKF